VAAYQNDAIFESILHNTISPYMS